MVKDLISIIVPCYNVEPYLDDLFSSFDNQTYKKFEVIFVNDGSTDNTLAKLIKYSKNRKNVLVINQKNSGVQNARNNALLLVRGEFVCIFDPDDIFHPDILKILHDAIVYTDSDVSICNYKKIPHSYKYRIITKKVCKFKKILIGKDDVMSGLLSMPTRAPWNKMYRTKIIQSMKEYPNVFNSKCFFADDSLFCSNYFSNCIKSVYVKNKLYYWRQRSGSITHGTFNNKLLTIYMNEQYLNTLDKDVYKITQNYIKSSACLDSMGLINRIYYTKNKCNKDDVLHVYNKYRDNLKYVIRGKLYNIPYRFGTMFTKPVMYLMIRKHLK